MTTPAIIKKLSRNVVARSIACWLGAQYIRIVDMTSFWKFDGDVGPEKSLKGDVPFIACFWHGRLMMMGSNWSRRSTLYMLISGHPDGKLIACIIQRLGFKTVEAASKTSGNAAMRSMLRILKNGSCIGFTPDGPRGPKEMVNEGIIRIAKKTNTPIIPLGFWSSKNIQLKSWDSFLITLPFSKCSFVWEEDIHIPSNIKEDQIEYYQKLLQEKIMQSVKKSKSNCSSWKNCL